MVMDSSLPKMTLEQFNIIKTKLVQMFNKLETDVQTLAAKNELSEEEFEEGGKLLEEYEKEEIELTKYDLSDVPFKAPLLAAGVVYRIL